MSFLAVGRIAPPTTRVMGIASARNDVVITCENERFFIGQKLGRMNAEAVHPIQLIGIFGCLGAVLFHGITIGQID